MSLNSAVPMTWQQGEHTLVSRLEELGYGEQIAHWSNINQFADGDVILRLFGCFITFDTKTAATARSDGNVTVNVPTYQRAICAWQRGQQIMIYNPYNDRVASMIPLIRETFRRGESYPLRSNNGGPDYYVGDGCWYGWTLIEQYLATGFGNV